MEKEICNVYIDEAGDLGIRRGTKWFVMSAVIVNVGDEPAIRDTIKAIRNKFNLREIHLRKMNDFYKTAYIVKELHKHPFVISNVLLDTDKIDSSKLKNSAVLYNYMCRYLLERVSWYLRDNQFIGNIILSGRGTKRDGELIHYIKNKLIPDESNQVVDVFNKISSKPAADWDLLQLADVCATSLFKAYEINSLGFTTPCHMSVLKDKIYKISGGGSYGMKFFSNEMQPNSAYFEGHRICAFRSVNKK